MTVILNFKNLFFDILNKRPIFIFFSLQLISLLTFYIHFFLSFKLLYHDSIIIQTSLHIFYNQVFNSDSFLWNPFLNSGQPLWPQIETVPVIDPIVILMWTISYVLNLKPTIAYALTVYFWLLLFSLVRFF